MTPLNAEAYAQRQEFRGSLLYDDSKTQFLNPNLIMPHKEMYVNHYFHLNENTVDLLHSMIPEFGYNGFGELVFYRTYSRIKDDGSNENWSDVVIRVINGIFSIRKNHYIKNMIDWNENWWQGFARQVAISLFKMHWLPPGRGLWAMGTNFVYERGAMSLYNCAALNLHGFRFGEDIEWLMDSLMVGVGVGFKALRDQINVKVPQGSYIYRIPDSREGWALSVRLLIEAFCQNKRLPIMEYSDIRPRGMPIQGFGGIASGPEPLQRLHGMIVETMYKYINKKIDIVRLKTDIANMVGVCVVAGNVRRSAEIAMGSIQDDSFMDLKDYEKYPDRQAYGWMSNNTAELLEDDDFELIREVANRVVVRGEPGIANLRNFKFGRIGKRNKNIREDKAKLLNPCGEITLEDREVCNLSETLPTRCETPAEWLDACRYASFYSSTVSLLPTHQPSTNAVIGRNRRIGVGIIDFTGWKQEFGLATVTKYLRKGYKIVRDTNTHFNSEAGVPSAIKVTTMKPGGTTPKIAGRTPGLGHPTFIYTLRSIRVADNAPVVPVLKRANIPYVIDEYDRHTLIFQFPIKQGPSKPSTEVSLWEQALNLVTLQREWSDNAVSNTLYFKPKWKLVSIYTPGLDEFLAQSSKFRELHYRFEGKLAAELEIGNYKIVKKSDGTYHFFEYNPQHEEGEIEHVLAHIAPLIKSCSLLPHSDTGAYKNMPEAGRSEYEYNDRLSKIKKLDWSTFTGSDGLDERYCQGETCEVAK